MGTHLRDILLGAVPPLPQPADRLGAVEARVRRRRTTTSVVAALAAAVAVTMAVGLPKLLSGPVYAPDPLTTVTGPLLADGCPPNPGPLPSRGPRPGEPGYSNRLGPLVPAGPVVSVSACTDRSIRTLTTGAAEVVAVLNALPAKVVEPVTYTTPPGEPPRIVHGGLRCNMAYYGWLAYAIRYAGDPAPVAVVTVDQNCRLISSNGADRVYDDKVGETFIRLYRAELTARQAPSDIPAPTCPPNLTQRQLYREDPADMERDGIDSSRVSAGFLAVPLAVAVVCRYTGTGGELSLAAHKTTRENLAGIRDVLNNPILFQASSCGRRKFETAAPATDAYTILVADVTTEVFEVRVMREPCLSLMDSVPTPELVSWLESAL